MKRMLVASLVLGLCAVTAPAVVITTTITPVGTYNVVYDTADVTVNVYDITVKAPVGWQLTAIDMTIGRGAS